MNNEQTQEIGYSQILLENIMECDRHYGLEDYHIFVERLRHSVVNLRNGPPLRTIIDEYRNGPWREGIKKELAQWKGNNPDLRDEINIVQDEEEKITWDNYPLLCDFIRGILEENGCTKQYYRGDDR